ncbi:MAG: hypothetical protein QNJ53_14905 [Pleurocapsa sp. MO_192.B19]|nr:hypothetical protein [Pleurocapsa sp. MO_192.B19]
MIYSENQIIKFGEANREAIKFLESGLDEIAHPMGFSRKVFKIMKLITRSQFLFQNEKQLRNFEKVNQLGKLDNLSKNVLTKSFWKKVDLELLKPYGVTELIPAIDYAEFAKSHTIGLGFELLAVNNSNNKSDITSVRNLIADNISNGVDNFERALKINRQLSKASNFKLLFAALIVLKANEEYLLKTRLVNSIDEPTALIVNRTNIYKFEELFATPDY